MGAQSTEDGDGDSTTTQSPGEPLRLPSQSSNSSADFDSPTSMPQSFDSFLDEFIERRHSLDSDSCSFAIPDLDDFLEELVGRSGPLIRGRRPGLILELPLTIPASGCLEPPKRFTVVSEVSPDRPLP